MGELHLLTAAEWRGVSLRQGEQGGGEALRNGFEDCVGEALFEVAEASSEGLGDAGGAALVAEKEVSGRRLWS